MIERWSGIAKSVRILMAIGSHTDLPSDGAYIITQLNLDHDLNLGLLTSSACCVWGCRSNIEVSYYGTWLALSLRPLFDRANYLIYQYMDFDHTLMKIEKFDEIAIPREKVGNLAYPMEGEIVISHSSYDRCGWEVIYPVLGPIPNGAGTMVLRVVFLFLPPGVNYCRVCIRRFSRHI